MHPQARFEEIRAQLLPFLKQCGFREANLQWLPAVGTLNENLTAPPADPRLAAWWEGPTLVQAIDAFRCQSSHVQSALMWLGWRNLIQSRHCSHGLCCLLCRPLLACAAGCFVCDSC